MSYLFNILAAFLLSVLSLSFFPNLTLFNTVPLLPLFYIIALTYFRKGVEPIILSALAGVFLDFFSSYSFGLYLSLFLGVAVVVRIFFQEGMKELSFVAFVSLASASLVIYYIAQLLMLHFNEVAIVPSGAFGRFLPFMVINLLSVALFYPVCIFYFERLNRMEDYEKRR